MAECMLVSRPQIDLLMYTRIYTNPASTRPTSAKGSVSPVAMLAF